MITPLLDEELHEPLYIQLYRHFRHEIVAGNMASSAKLPSIRELSTHLKLSKSTVHLAYQQLLAEGYIESRERSGYFVVQMNHDGVLRASVEGVGMQKTIPPFGRQLRYVDYDFYMSNIDVSKFPRALWRKYMNQVMDGNDDYLSYGDAEGETGLRHEISHYLRRSRGVNCSPEQVVIAAGTRNVVRIIREVLDWPTKLIAVENPGYDGVKQVFMEKGIQVAPIPLEADGLDIGALGRSGAKVVYVTPSHQYPLGMVMSINKRMKLLTWAMENQGLIIEDDYDGEFRYHGRPIPSLQGLDAFENVVYIGTFSKSLTPAIRLSYAVLPQRLLRRYYHLIEKFDQTASRIHQKTLQLFMESGEWDRHLRRMRTLYGRKHDVLLNSLREVFGSVVDITGQDAGLHIVLDVAAAVPTRELLEIAEQNGCRLYSAERHWVGEPGVVESKVLMGFGGLSEDEIRNGVLRLKEAWKPYLPSS